MKKALLAYQNLSEATQQRVTDDNDRLFESFTGDAEALAHFGYAAESQQLESIPAQVALIEIILTQAQRILTSATSMDFSEDELSKEHGAPTRTFVVEIRRSPEQVLQEIFDRGDKDFIGRFLSTTGRIESIQSETQRLACHQFDDGSILARVASRDGSNDALRNALLDSATNAKDFMPIDEIKSIKNPLVQIAKSMIDRQTPKPVTEQLPALLEKQTLLACQTIAKAPQLLLPLPDSASFNHVFSKVSEGAAWKDGVEVKIDGINCAAPSDALAQFGISTPINLADALARMRAGKPHNEPGASAAPGQ